MFLETRQVGKKKKYYLVHSYRLEKAIKRISHYLGTDLTETELATKQTKAEKLILNEIAKIKHSFFELSSHELREYRKKEQKLKISHLYTDWRTFTQTFVYNTNAIEGSRLSFEEVKSILEHKIKPESDDEFESVNLQKAVAYIQKTKQKMSVYLIEKLHKICFKDTKHFAGKLRTVEVVIRDKSGNIIHQGAPAKDVPDLLRELVLWYNRNKKTYPPLLLAALMHNQLENIHPFQDGNGRVGRLLLNFVLLKHKYPVIDIRLEDRQEYYRTLQIFQKIGHIKPTIDFLLKELKKQFK